MFGKSKKNSEINIYKESDESFLGQGWLGNDDEGQLTLDIFQDADNIYIKSAIAGVGPKDLEISMNNDMLTIRGRRTQEDEIEEKDYFYKECYWGNFSRSVILPTEVKSDNISAVLKNGILTITLPKLIRQKNIPISIKE